MSDSYLTATATRSKDAQLGSRTPHRSSAREWASQCAVNGVMRPWVDLDGQAVANGRSCSMDVMLWTASLLLLHYLEHADVDWTGTRLLELSAGTGHLAVGMARLGADVTATECSPKHGARAFEVLELWTARLLSDSRHQPVAGTLRTKVLDWGAEDGLEEDAASNEHYDVILLSELVGLGEELQAELLKTFRRLLGPNTVAYSIAVDRGAFSLGFLWLLAWHPDEFLVEELQLSDRLGLDEDEVVFFHQITRVKPSGAE